MKIFSLKMSTGPIPDFEFISPKRIIFSSGAALGLDALVAQYQGPALIFTGSNPFRYNHILNRLKNLNFKIHIYPVSAEPTLENLQTALTNAREAGCKLVISIGGGSVIDTGKAVAALLANPGDILDYLEVIGAGQPLTREALPFIAVPTTAGTGAEVTCNAVLESPRHKMKVSLRSPLMLARIALIDPELTWSLPPQETAHSGMDALTQVLEPYVSLKANPLTDALCRHALSVAGNALPLAWLKGEDTEARARMCLVSLYGGLALTNARLGAVHGLAGTLGGMYPAGHGALCAALLPHVFAANYRALRERDSANPVLKRFEDIARLLTGKAQAQVPDGIDFLKNLCLTLKIAPLAAYGVRTGDFNAVIEKALTSSSMKGNPVSLTSPELEAILNQALN